MALRWWMEKARSPCLWSAVLSSGHVKLSKSGSPPGSAEHQLGCVLLAAFGGGCRSFAELVLSAPRRNVLLRPLLRVGGDFLGGFGFSARLIEEAKITEPLKVAVLPGTEGNTSTRADRSAVSATSVDMHLE